MMTVTTAPPVAAPAFSRPVVFCIIPSDLVHLYEPLCDWSASYPEVEVVMERRAAGDRRVRASVLPPGVTERRQGERRAPADDVAAPELPWPQFAEPYAGRLRIVRRNMPVDVQAIWDDDARDGERLLAGDMSALDDLWLRHHDQVRREILDRVGSGPRGHRMAQQTFARVIGQLIADPASDVSRTLHEAAHDVLAVG